MLHYHYIRKVRKTMNQYHYEVGDIVKLKKQHPCGSSEWEILRVGADFRLKCVGCGIPQWKGGAVVRSRPSGRNRY